MPSVLYNFSRKLKEDSSKWKKATILRSFWKTGSGFGAEKNIYINKDFYLAAVITSMFSIQCIKKLDGDSWHQ